MRWVSLCTLVRVNTTRGRSSISCCSVVVDPVIALEGDAVDDRVLGNHHDEVVALALQAHVGKEPGGEEVLQGVVEAHRIEGNAGIDAPVGTHRGRRSEARSDRKEGVSTCQNGWLQDR